MQSSAEFVARIIVIWLANNIYLRVFNFIAKTKNEYIKGQVDQNRF